MIGRSPDPRCPAESDSAAARLLPHCSNPGGCAAAPVSWAGRDPQIPAISVVRADVMPGSSA